MKNCPETDEELCKYLVEKYEKEIRISKRVFFSSLIFIITVLTFVALNRPAVLASTNSFLIFVILYAIPAALMCVSGQAYCFAKSGVISWKNKK